MRLLPQRLINSFRGFTNVALDTYGMDCTLYIPSNMNTVETSDIYAKPSDYTFDQHFTKVWVEWAPNKHRLRKLGIFMEDETPIIAWFGNITRNPLGLGDDIDICIKSYFVLPTQYIPLQDLDTEEFEIVDVLIPSMADKVVRKCFKIAPRRIKTP